MLALVASLIVLGCSGDPTQLVLINKGGATLIVQPDRSQPYPGCYGCTDYHKAILLDATHNYAEDIYAEPGSLVRVFSEACVLLDSFSFSQRAGLGATAFQIDVSGHVTTVNQFNIAGDPAAGATEHSPCPIS